MKSNQSTSTRDNRVTQAQLREAMEQLRHQLTQDIVGQIRQARDKRVEKIKQEALMRGMRNLFRK